MLHTTPPSTWQPARDLASATALSVTSSFKSFKDLKRMSSLPISHSGQGVYFPVGAAKAFHGHLCRDVFA